MSVQSASLLILLKDKEEQERDKRKSHVVEAQDRLGRAQSQADQLQAYRRHYHDHWQLQFKSGASPQVLQCYRQFVDRLDTALLQQAHTVRHLSGLVERAEQELLQQEIRVAAIEKLLERRSQQAELAQRKLQQRNDDEWAQRAAARGSRPLLALGPT